MTDSIAFSHRSRWLAPVSVAVVLLAGGLAGCDQSASMQGPPPPTAGVPESNAPELMGGPPNAPSAPAAQIPPPAAPSAMAPVANPESMSREERIRVYGHRYDYLDSPDHRRSAYAGEARARHYGALATGAHAATANRYAIGSNTHHAHHASLQAQAAAVAKHGSKAGAGSQAGSSASGSGSSAASGAQAQSAAAASAPAAGSPQAGAASSSPSDLKTLEAVGLTLLALAVLVFAFTLGRKPRKRKAGADTAARPNETPPKDDYTPIN